MSDKRKLKAIRFAKKHRAEIKKKKNLGFWREEGPGVIDR